MLSSQIAANYILPRVWLVNPYLGRISSTEFHAEKDYRIKGGPPRPTGYENAIRALQECAEKYQHPAELKKLNGVGPTCISRYVLSSDSDYVLRDQALTTDRLTEKLEKYCANKRIPMPEPPAPKRRGELLSPACLSPS